MCICECDVYSGATSNPKNECLQHSTHFPYKATCKVFTDTTWQTPYRSSCKADSSAHTLVLRTSTDCLQVPIFETQLQTPLGVQLLLEKTYFFSEILQFEEGSSTLHLSLDEGGWGHLEKGGGASYIPCMCSTYTCSLVPRLLVGQEPGHPTKRAGYEASTHCVYTST